MQLAINVENTVENVGITAVFTSVSHRGAGGLFPDKQPPPARGETPHPLSHPSGNHCKSASYAIPFSALPAKRSRIEGSIHMKI
jgi:hypothetical protein